MQIFSSPNPRLTELYRIILDAQAEISRIRGSCRHESGSHAMMYSWRPGAMQPSLICNDCEECIPGITPEQSDELWRQFNSMTYVTHTTTEDEAEPTKAAGQDDPET
jgi:hypothetical protein